jgi:DNA-binding NarL/FixJ family response regulator
VPPIRLLIVDDNDLVGQTLSRSCRIPEIEVLAVATTAAEALAAAEQTPPDVVLMDHRLAGEDGLVVAASLLEAVPTAKVIVVSGAVTPDVRRRAAEIGCWGCLEKTMSLGRALAGVVQKVHAGEPVE